jgi:hypothetical protein
MLSLSPVTSVEKQEWINSIGNDTYIACYSRQSAFFNTSCLLTAAVLRHRISNELWWKYVGGSEDEENRKLTPKFIKENPIFQMGFGSDGDYDSHIITIYYGKIYHSFFRITNWEERELPSQFNDLPEEPIEMTPDLIDALVGSDRLSPDSYDYQLFVPILIDISEQVEIKLDPLCSDLK